MRKGGLRPVNILLCGGFLGAGKTTLINKLLRGMTARGLTVAVVENEAGQEGIDTALVEAGGIRVTPLFGGCVCCQISGEMLTAVQRIEDELAPDWVVVEMSGLALMDGIRDTFRRYGRPSLVLHTLAVADMARWPKLLRAMEPVIRRQLAGAGVVAVNKVDLAPPGAGELAQVAELAPGAVLVPLSAAGAEPVQVWDQIHTALLRGEEAQA